MEKAFAAIAAGRMEERIVSKRHFALAIAACVAAAGITLPQTAHASTEIRIELGGIDVSFGPDPSGFSISSSATELSGATFFVDGVEVGTLTDDVFLDDLIIPGLEEFPVAGGSQLSDPFGGFDVIFDVSATDFIALDLAEVAVFYVPASGVPTGELVFVFAGGAAEVLGQSLPFGLEIAEPISVTVSAPIDVESVVTTLIDGEEFVVGFTATGTGEIVGVPEPTTAMLLAASGLWLLRRRRAA